MKYKQYPSYKESSVKWLGDIPEHWEAKKLKFLAYCFPSNVDKKSKEGEKVVYLCNYTDVYYNDVVNNDMLFMKATATKEQVIKFALKADDVIITKDSEDPRDIAVATYIPNDLDNVICGYHLSMIRAYKENRGSFLKYVFDSNYANSVFATTCNGLTRYGLGSYAIDNAIFTQAPLQEQKSIANYLDKATTKIDTLIEKQTKLIELLKEKRQAVISSAVTRGLDASVPMKDSGVEWLGEIPEHWDVSKFKYEIDFQEGPGILGKDFYEKGVPLIRISNLSEKTVSTSFKQYLSLEKVKNKWNHFKVKKGDLLISASATTGIISEVDSDCVGAIPYTGIIRLKPNTNKIIKDYIRWFVLSNAFLTQIDNFKTGTAMQHFGPYHLNMMGAIKLPLKEQLTISVYLDKTTSKIDNLITKSTQAIDLLKEKRTALISAAVTGKIDVRDAA